MQLRSGVLHHSCLKSIFLDLDISIFLPRGFWHRVEGIESWQNGIPVPQLSQPVSKVSQQIFLKLFFYSGGGEEGEKHVECTSPL